MGEKAPVNELAPCYGAKPLVNPREIKFPIGKFNCADR
jgi:hypothetical protein